MEFFEWMSIPQMVLYYFTPGFNTIDEFLSLDRKILLISMLVAAGIYLLSHLLGGFGLYKIAKRAGEKLAWMAFVPFLNTYLAGRIAGETNIFGIKCKRIGLYAAIAEVVYVALNIFVLVISLTLARPEWNEFTYETVGENVYITGTQYIVSNIPVGLRWMANAEFALEIVAQIWYFVMVLTFCMMFFAFFRKYYARSPFLMAFLCSFFPVRGFVLFAVRNNAAVDYQAWMQERIRRMQQQQQQMYGPYSQPPYGTPYGNQQPPQNGGSGTPEEPFGDFGGSNESGNGTPPPPDEPFSDL